MTDRATARHLRIPADIERMADVRTFVRDAALEAGAPPTCIDDLIQAIDEAATNVVLHGYRGEPGDIDVTVDADGNDLVVTVADSAPTFDPTAVAAPDLSIPPERRTPGGMGIHLIRAATDVVIHSPRAGGGNILTMTRRVDPRPKEER